MRQYLFRSSFPACAEGKGAEAVPAAAVVPAVRERVIWKMSGAPPGKEAAVELTSGQARYLLAVYHLGLGARGVRCADIARMLDVTRPSVVKMLSFFSQRCLIARERYGKVYLTDTGCLLARCYARRLEKVERMLAAELALTREEAQLAACALLDVLPERCFTQGEVPSA